MLDVRVYFEYGYHHVSSVYALLVNLVSVHFACMLHVLTLCIITVYLSLLWWLCMHVCLCVNILWSQVKDTGIKDVPPDLGLRYGWFYHLFFQGLGPSHPMSWKFSTTSREGEEEEHRLLAGPGIPADTWGCG